MGVNDKAETDVRREMQEAARRYDLSTAWKLRDVVLNEIRNGVRPEWIATKYKHLGATLERVLNAKEEIERRAEAKRKAVAGND